MLMGCCSLRDQAAQGPNSRLQKPGGRGKLCVNGDVLGISVWKETDLQQQVIIAPTKLFLIPLTGDVRPRPPSNIRSKSRTVWALPDPVVNVRP